MRWIAVAGTLTFVASVSAQEITPKPDVASADSLILRRLFKDDQGDRKTGVIDAGTVKRDKGRREKVLGELRAGRLRTANDYYHAAIVFQHGESADDIRLAFSLAWTSARMDPEKKTRALWLSAAAWDRLMMRLQKPQWYGTQYVADDEGSEFRLYQIDEDAVTDQERKRLSVPALDEAKKRVTVLNRRLRNKSDEQTNALEPAVGSVSNGKPSPPAR